MRRQVDVTLVRRSAALDLTRGWCRVTGLTTISLFAATSYVARNQRILDAFETRRLDDERRSIKGLEPKTRRRRRKTLDDLVNEVLELAN